MTDEEMIASIKVLLDDERLDKYAEHYLERAKSAIVERLYPYKSDAAFEDVPVRFHANAVEIAVYLINRRGSEGETSHNESGTQRTYESAGIPNSYFRGITPFVGVPE